MQKLMSATAILAATTTLASAGGLDRSGQSIGILFEEGNYAELSFGFTSPSVNGSDLNTGANTGNVADNFVTAGFGLKYQFNDKVSFALIVDEPYGSDIDYPVTPTSVSLGGTGATVDSYAVTGVVRYKFDDNFSVHGGLRYQEISADVSLGGLVYGPLNGYNASFASTGDVGYLIGAAYERPDIALRVALTYNSGTTHDLDTVESLPAALAAAFGPTVSSSTTVETPESINLDFQTGIAKDTLLFGSVRYARYTDTIVSPVIFDQVVNETVSGDSLTSIEDSLDLALGVGYRFNAAWSGSVALGYSRPDVNSLVSPLAPIDGTQSITVGARYTHKNMVISGGIRYTRFGDALPETGTPDEARASFTDNDAVSAGLRIGYRF
ncbi:MAG: outer membrane protein transport protein [Litoreibacter sp.]